MKKPAAAFLAGLLFAFSLPAAAGGWDDRHGRWGHRHHHDHRHGVWPWAVPGLVLGAGILAIEATRPPPVIVAPVVTPPIRPPGRLWYYCETYRAYYPAVQFCPEGWRAVLAY